MLDDPGTVALNCCVRPAPIIAEPGDTDISLRTVTVALALADVSATLVAVTVCVPVTEGAVYKPAAVIVPTLAFPPLTLSTAQVTAVLLEPVTVAVNCVVAPTAMFAVV